MTSRMIECNIFELLEYVDRYSPSLLVTRRDGSRQKVPSSILSNEAFSHNFEFLGNAILRQYKFHISAKSYPIDFR